MKIAILSDIHDHIWNLKAALELAQPAEAVICCGDLCSPFIINLLAGGFPERPIQVVFGNNDADLFRITRNAARYPHLTLHGHFYQGELGGKRLAAVHYDDLAAPLARSGAYDLLCYGHNHRFKIEQVGQTLAVNPGAIMGYDPLEQQDIPATFILYDTYTGQAERCELP
jgi:putative phosphoesterase